MRYSVVMWMLGEMVRALPRFPGAVWCYFVHSWRDWKRKKRNQQDWVDHLYRCEVCGREWQRIDYGW